MFDAAIYTYPFSLVEKSRIDKYANIFHVESSHVAHNMPPTSLKSKFSLFSHWRLQISTSHLCKLHTGPRLASQLAVDSNKGLKHTFLLCCVPVHMHYSAQ